VNVGVSCACARVCLWLSRVSARRIARPLVHCPLRSRRLSAARRLVWVHCVFPLLPASLSVCLSVCSLLRFRNQNKRTSHFVESHKLQFTRHAAAAADSSSRRKRAPVFPAVCADRHRLTQTFWIVFDELNCVPPTVLRVRCAWKRAAALAIALLLLNSPRALRAAMPTLTVLQAPLQRAGNALERAIPQYPR
jgi:hypothetical protein